MIIEFSTDEYGNPLPVVDVTPRAPEVGRRTNIDLRRVPFRQHVRYLSMFYRVKEKTIQALVRQLEIKITPSLDNPALEMIALEDGDRIISFLQKAVRIRAGMKG